MNLSKKLFAEFFGTAWLVFGGCGAAIFAAAVPGLGIGYLGVALAFGLTLLTMAFAIGHISGCHINPAVSIGLAVGRRFPMAHVLPYIAAQVSGAFVAASALYVIARGKPGFVLGNFAANGYGVHSPGGYTMQSCFIAEMILTFFFLFIIFGATDVRAPKGFGPIAIGLGLTLIHLVGIPITNTSVNPARSTSPGAVCAWMGAGPTLALLAGADSGGSAGGTGLQGVLRGETGTFVACGSQPGRSTRRCRERRPGTDGLRGGGLFPGAAPPGGSGSMGSISCRLWKDC